jgi:hypothetical protein
MREYKIKKGHNPDVDALVDKYFGMKGDLSKGITFETEAIGKINMKKEKKSLFVDIEPPQKITGGHDVIKKWNNFLYEVTGKTAKERKKDLSTIKS